VCEWRVRNKGDEEVKYGTLEGKGEDVRRDTSECVSGE